MTDGRTDAGRRMDGWTDRRVSRNSDVDDDGIVRRQGALAQLFIISQSYNYCFICCHLFNISLEIATKNCHYGIVIRDCHQVLSRLIVALGCD